MVVIRNCTVKQLMNIFKKTDDDREFIRKLESINFICDKIIELENVMNEIEISIYEINFT